MVNLLMNAIYTDRDLDKLFGITRKECGIAYRLDYLKGRYVYRSGYRFLGSSVQEYLAKRDDILGSVIKISITRKETVSQKKAGLLRLRWRVLNRDKFTCQYCGRKAPEVVLELDHVLPFTKGGLTVMENLKTACRDCNRGKFNLEL